MFLRAIDLWKEDGKHLPGHSSRCRNPRYQLQPIRRQPMRRDSSLKTLEGYDMSSTPTSGYRFVKGLCLFALWMSEGIEVRDEMRQQQRTLRKEMKEASCF